MEPDKILVIRTGGLGDTLLLWPGLSSMRRRFVESRIDLMGHRERCEPLVVPGGINRALEVEGSGLHHLFRFAAELPPKVRSRFGAYHVVVVFATPGEYALAENLSGCGAKEVHAFLPFPAEADQNHVADHIKQALVDVDMAIGGPDPLLPVTECEQVAGKEVIENLTLGNRPFALLAPGSGSKRKCWGPEKYAKLAVWMKSNGVEPILLEGPADAEVVSSTTKHFSKSAPLVLRGHPPSVLKGIISHASLLVGNDAGTTHLSAMIGVRTVAIFGPTDPMRWKPRGPNVRLLTPMIKCSPCTPDIMHICQEQTCLEQIEVNQVISTCSELLASTTD